MNEILHVFPGGKCKAMTFSYDDGPIYDRRLTSLFRKYNLKGTFNLCSGRFDMENSFSSKEAPEVYEGFEIASHTKNHPHLQNIEDVDFLASEILEDKIALEKIFNESVYGFVLPYGEPHSGVMAEKLLKEQIIPKGGFCYIRPVKYKTDFSLPEDFLDWHATAHHSQDIITKGREFLSLPEVKQSLFYVWGHSFEFKTEEQWTEMEEFCRMISGQSDVWYASNAEIALYLLAQKQLVKKEEADKTILNNQSNMELWLKINGEIVKIAAGETKKVQ